jgi:cation transport regulator ChaB
MPELPKTLQRSERHAQEVWLKTLESAMETYEGDNGRSRRVAFASLKHQYEKKGNRWVKKTDKGPSDPQAARGSTTRHKSTDEPRAATALGRVAKTEKEARRKAKEARREYSTERAKENRKR